MHHPLSRRFAVLLAALVTATAAPIVLPGAAVAAPTVQRSALTTHVGATPLALFGRSRYRSPYSRPTYRRTYPYRYRNRGFGRGFFHGLFWGWMASHFFGFGYGVPLFFPFLIIVFVLFALRRRRRPPYPPYGYRAW